MEFLYKRKQGGSGNAGRETRLGLYDQWEVVTRGNTECGTARRGRGPRSQAGGESGQDKGKERTDIGGTGLSSEGL